jgi:hypothetical protein
MFQRLARPLPLRAVLALGIAVLAANTAYCLLYTALAGRTESLGQAFGWSAANLLPWLLAFEAGKRSRRPITAILGGAAISMLLGMLLLGAEPTWFELARRVPGALMVLGLLVAIQSRELRVNGTPVELPLPPEQIAWVSAAGNYVELHGGPRPLLVRASMAAIESALSPHGFVRIHRSTLVNKRRVRSVRRADLLLDNGRSLKVGTRFRAALLT